MWLTTSPDSSCHHHLLNSSLSDPESSLNLNNRSHTSSNNLKSSLSNKIASSDQASDSGADLSAKSDTNVNSSYHNKKPKENSAGDSCSTICHEHLIKAIPIKSFPLSSSKLAAKALSFKHAVFKVGARIYSGPAKERYTINNNKAGRLNGTSTPAVVPVSLPKETAKDDAVLPNEPKPDDPLEENTTSPIACTETVAATDENKDIKEVTDVTESVVSEDCESTLVGIGGEVNSSTTGDDVVSSEKSVDSNEVSSNDFVSSSTSNYESADDQIGLLNSSDSCNGIDTEVDSTKLVEDVVEKEENSETEAPCKVLKSDQAKKDVNFSKCNGIPKLIIDDDHVSVDAVEETNQVSNTEVSNDSKVSKNVRNKRKRSPDRDQQLITKFFKSGDKKDIHAVDNSSINSKTDEIYKSLAKEHNEDEIDSQTTDLNVDYSSKADKTPERDNNLSPIPQSSKFSPVFDSKASAAKVSNSSPKASNSSPKASNSSPKISNSSPDLDFASDESVFESVFVDALRKSSDDSVRDGSIDDPLKDDSTDGIKCAADTEVEKHNLQVPRATGIPGFSFKNINTETPSVSSRVITPSPTFSINDDSLSPGRPDIDSVISSLGDIDTVPKSYKASFRKRCKAKIGRKIVRQSNNIPSNPGSLLINISDSIPQDTSRRSSFNEDLKLNTHVANNIGVVKTSCLRSAKRVCLTPEPVEDAKSDSEGCDNTVSSDSKTSKSKKLKSTDKGDRKLIGNKELRNLEFNFKNPTSKHRHDPVRIKTISTVKQDVKSVDNNLIRRCTRTRNSNSSETLNRPSEVDDLEEDLDDSETILLKSNNNKGFGSNEDITRSSVFRSKHIRNKSLKPSYRDNWSEDTNPKKSKNMVVLVKDNKSQETYCRKRGKRFSLRSKATENNSFSDGKKISDYLPVCEPDFICDENKFTQKNSGGKNHIKITDFFASNVSKCNVSYSNCVLSSNNKPVKDKDKCPTRRTSRNSETTDYSERLTSNCSDNKGSCKVTPINGVGQRLRFDKTVSDKIKSPTNSVKDEPFHDTENGKVDINLLLEISPTDRNNFDKKRAKIRRKTSDWSLIDETAKIVNEKREILQNKNKPYDDSLTEEEFSEEDVRPKRRRNRGKPKLSSKIVEANSTDEEIEDTYNDAESLSVDLKVDSPTKLSRSCVKSNKGKSKLLKKLESNSTDEEIEDNFNDADSLSVDLKVECPAKLSRSCVKSNKVKSKLLKKLESNSTDEEIEDNFNDADSVDIKVESPTKLSRSCVKSNKGKSKLSLKKVESNSTDEDIEDNFNDGDSVDIKVESPTKLSRTCVKSVDKNKLEADNFLDDVQPKNDLSTKTSKTEEMLWKTKGRGRPKGSRNRRFRYDLTSLNDQDTDDDNFFSFPINSGLGNSPTVVNRRFSRSKHNLGPSPLASNPKQSTTDEDKIPIKIESERLTEKKEDCSEENSDHQDTKDTGKITKSQPITKSEKKVPKNKKGRGRPVAVKEENEVTEDEKIEVKSDAEEVDKDVDDFEDPASPSCVHEIIKTCTKVTDSLCFSFEKVPNAEPWYRTYRRQLDDNQMNDIPLKQDDLRFIMPYEMPREYFRDHVARRNLANKKKNELAELARKSPRCHASTMALFGHILPVANSNSTKKSGRRSKGGSTPAGDDSKDEPPAEEVTHDINSAMEILSSRVPPIGEHFETFDDYLAIEHCMNYVFAETGDSIPNEESSEQDLKSKEQKDNIDGEKCDKRKKRKGKKERAKKLEQSKDDDDNKSSEKKTPPRGKLRSLKRKLTTKANSEKSSKEEISETPAEDSSTAYSEFLKKLDLQDDPLAMDIDPSFLMEMKNFTCEEDDTLVLCNGDILDSSIKDILTESSSNKDLLVVDSNTDHTPTTNRQKKFNVDAACIMKNLLLSSQSKTSPSGKRRRKTNLTGWPKAKRKRALVGGSECSTPLSCSVAASDDNDSCMSFDDAKLRRSNFETDVESGTAVSRRTRRLSTASLVEDLEERRVSRGARSQK